MAPVSQRPYRRFPRYLLAAFASLVAGVGCDDPIDPSPVCSIAVAPPASTFASDGGTATVTVTASAPSCTWVTAGGASWVSILEGASGVGSGTVSYRVSTNTSVEARSATLTIGNQPHAISQQGRPPTVCAYTLSPTNAVAAHTGLAGTFTVSAPADCAWVATPSAPWITVTDGLQGTGNGSVSYAVARNRDSADRAATIVVADQTFAVVQLGEPPEPVPCEYSVAPVQLSSCMEAGTVMTRIETQASCGWSVSADAPWMTILSGASGSGSADISVAFSANFDAPRQGVIMVRWPSPTAGQNVRLSQAGCIYGVTRTAFSFSAGGGADRFDVVQQSDPMECGGPKQDRCTWTATSDVSWISITTPMPKTGDSPVLFTVAANGSSAARQGTIRVRDKTISVTQSGQ